MWVAAASLTSTAFASPAVAPVPAPAATAPAATVPATTAPVATTPVGTTPVATAPVATAPVATAPSAASSPPAAPAAEAGPAQEVSVEAPEPRYVAPTLRDRIGRIWAPVLVDGKGPFRLVLDTGANHSAVIASVAQALGIAPGPTLVRLRGVLATAAVPSIQVESLVVGDLQIDSTMLPIIPDALGGAQGVLGTEGLLDKRIFIDFRHDLITIKRSHEQRADFGYVTVPVKILPNHLISITAYVGSIRATAIIDTGAQTSIANLALREALVRRRRGQQFTPDKIVDTTDTEATAEGASVPPIRIGDIRIQSAHITTGDLQIFDAWGLTDKPALLIGMDALGTVDVLIIDYRRHELQILPRSFGLQARDFGF